MPDAGNGGLGEVVRGRRGEEGGAAFGRADLNAAEKNPLPVDKLSGMIRVLRHDNAA